MSDLSGEVFHFLLKDKDVPQDSGNYKKYQYDDCVIDRKPVGNNEQKAETHVISEIQEQTKLSPADFMITKLLGQGGYGMVYLVQKTTGHDAFKNFAMKVLKKVKYCENLKDAEHARSERNILATVKHPFIVEMAYAFQTKDKLCMVLEYMSKGDLSKLLKRQIRFSEVSARFISSEIILALGHLHALGILYRDLKPGNILLDTDGHVKLTDFGLSKEHMQEDLTTYTLCGSLNYIAPEVLNKKGYGKDVDWWSLGALIYELITGQQPFNGENQGETINNIFMVHVKFPAYLKQEIRDLVRGLLRRTVSKRLGSGPDDAIAVQSHAFFKNTNWDDVLAKRLKSPIKSLLHCNNDVSEFDEEEYSDQIPVDSLTSSKLDVNWHCEGFSYEEPSPIDETRTNNPKSKRSPQRLNRH